MFAQIDGLKAALDREKQAASSSKSNTDATNDSLRKELEHARREIKEAQDEVRFDIPLLPASSGASACRYPFSFPQVKSLKSSATENSSKAQRDKTKEADALSKVKNEMQSEVRFAESYQLSLLMMSVKKQIDSLKAALDREKQASKNQADALSDYKTDAREQSEKAESLRKELEDLRQEMKDLRKEADIERLDADDLRRENEKLTRQNEELRAEGTSSTTSTTFTPVEKKVQTVTVTVRPLLFDLSSLLCLMIPCSRVPRTPSALPRLPRCGCRLLQLSPLVRFLFQMIAIYKCFTFVLFSEKPEIPVERLDSRQLMQLLESLDDYETHSEPAKKTDNAAAAAALDALKEEDEKEKEQEKEKEKASKDSDKLAHKSDSAVPPPPPLCHRYAFLGVLLQKRSASTSHKKHRSTVAVTGSMKTDLDSLLAQEENGGDEKKRKSSTSSVKSSDDDVKKSSSKKSHSSSSSSKKEKS